MGKKGLGTPPGNIVVFAAYAPAFRAKKVSKS